AFDLTELQELASQKSGEIENKKDSQLLNEIADRIVEGEMKTSLGYATKEVVIKVEDINDNPPMFTEPLSFEASSL
ncbi:hypothetical protein Ciccas_010216, partial [Cichlidogyrus casuarinus]